MAVTDFFAGEIATELVKLLIDVSRKSLLCKSWADQLHSYINQLLPIVEEIKYSGIELSAVHQHQLDRISETLRSGVELCHKVLSSSRWNVYKNLQLAKKMEKLEKDVSRFVNGPMQAHILADVHHTRFEMAERFDRLEASNRRLEASHRRLEQYLAAINGPMQAHILAGVHHTRFEMAERFDRLEASHRRLEQDLAAIKSERHNTSSSIN